ncbi:DUF2185 domain-containing protein [uncultured Litoreibacter sp.]|uniref:immunity protein Imm33 domain-containing protein n=1 Tax=uncultured Litoreibacter sp. TaxID=1392394 RepID=UPI002629F100|nr:DUF2185 domain-containing protein [uncultured Litoreibacter sp.]
MIELLVRWLPNHLFDVYRRWFGTYEILDPRPMARQNPFTFHLPENEEVEAIEPGGLVKLIFTSIPEARDTAGERMWLIVTGRDGAFFEGVLDNIPSDIPQLRYQQEIKFEAHHIIDVIWNDDANRAKFAGDDQKWFMRCLVDDCVVYEDVPIGLIYREEAEKLGGEHADSGWRILGDQTGLDESEIDARTRSWIAIGVVLNRDDGFVDLLHHPAGSAFERDAITGQYVPERIH